MALSDHVKELRKIQYERAKTSEKAREGRNRRSRNRYYRLIAEGYRWNGQTKEWELKTEQAGEKPADDK